jgi:hypothetical protein
VFLNGVLLNSTDYTASNGTTIVLGVAAALNDIVEVIAYNVTSLGTATASTNIAGGTAGVLPYQTGPGATGFTAAGTAGQLLQSNGTSAPTWVAAPSTSAAGSTGQLQYNNAGAFAAVSSGTAGQVLTSAGAGVVPTWATASSPGPYKNDIVYSDAAVTFSSAISSTTTSTGYLGVVCVQITATTELVLIWGNASCHAVVWDNTTKTFGTPALVRTAVFATAQDVAGTLISSTSVLVNTLPGSGTALQTVVLSISGSTITVNTPVSTTLAGNALFINTTNIGNGANRCQAVGSSFVLSYIRTYPSLRAITVSGTVPTIGAELLLSGTTTSMTNATMTTYVYSSSVVVQIGSSATLVYATGIGVSGSTLTLGSTATTTCVGGSSLVTGQYASGNIFAAYIFTGSLVYASVISVSLTSPSFSSGSTGITGSSGDLLNAEIIGNKALVYDIYQYTGNMYNLVTDNAGTMVMGTALQAVGPGGNYSRLMGTNGTDTFYMFSDFGSPYNIVISGNNVVAGQQFPSINILATSTVLLPDQISSAANQPYNVNLAGIKYSNMIRGASNKHVRMFAGSPANSPYIYALCFDGAAITTQSYQPYLNSLIQRSALGTSAFWTAAKLYGAVSFRRMELP